MAKPSDILNKSGTGGFGTPKPSNTINISTTPKKDLKENDSIASRKPDQGHNLHKGTDKSKGGAGGSSARPKV